MERRSKTSHLTPLAGLTELTRLFVGNTNISDLTPLTNLKRLQDLGVSNTRVQGASVVLKLPSLVRCYLDQQHHEIANELHTKLPNCRVQLTKKQVYGWKSR